MDFSKYNLYCGTSLEVLVPHPTHHAACPKCGVGLAKNSAFCHSCGTRLIASGKPVFSEEHWRRGLLRFIERRFSLNEGDWGLSTADLGEDDSLGEVHQRVVVLLPNQYFSPTKGQPFLAQVKTDLVMTISRAVVPHADIVDAAMAYLSSCNAQVVQQQLNTAVFEM